MKLNDALVKVDTGVEATIRKVEKQIKDLDAEADLKIDDQCEYLI